MSQRILIAVFAAMLGSASLHAAGHILVASTRSQSIEEFSAGGAWLDTFATTGPYAPVALAQNPTTGEIYATTVWGSGPTVGQLTNRILRYEKNGKFDVNWDTFTVPSVEGCPTSQTQSLLFDPSGNLWVATAYGTDLGGPICIFEYLAASLTMVSPPAQPSPIRATLYRGGQMAFNLSGDLCIASFIDGDVQCFNTSTAALTQDYKVEIAASGLAIEPGGLAFDGNDRMYLTSIFTGQLAKEVNPGGPIVLVATLPLQLQGDLVLRGGEIYVTAWNPSPPTFSSPDPVYEVSTTGTVTVLIGGAAAPALGDDHLWGAYWMIFY